MQPQSPLNPTPQPQPPLESLPNPTSPQTNPGVSPLAEVQQQSTEAAPLEQGTPLTPQSTVQEMLKGNGSANDVINRLISTNPKVKYGLAILLIPIIAITLLQGGSISDVFTQKISGSELRELVQTTANDHKAVYGYSIMLASDVDCNGGLKNEEGATVDCVVNASRTLGGKIKGQLKITAQVRSRRTSSSPVQIDLLRRS